MPVVPQPCAPGGGEPGGGGCCAPSIATSTWCTRDQGVVLVVVTAPCGSCDGGVSVPEVAGWIDPATGELTPGPPPEGAPCQGGTPGQECATVETIPRCDATPDGCVPFLRRLVLDCDGQVTATVDTAPDGVTPYVPVGEIIDCDNCPCEAGEKTLPLCDWLPSGSAVQFLRHIEYDCVTGAVTDQQDTELDGVTPYAPVGEVGECDRPCRPPSMCPRLEGLSGPDVWEMPPGTESVSLSIVCGPVVITDCVGQETRVNERGVTFAWSAPGADCHPGELCEPFSVALPDPASAVYINYLTTCDGDGDES